MPINIDQEILKVDAEILALQGKKPALISARDAWAQQSTVACTQTLASKRQECVQDKNWKASNASQIQTQIQAIDLEIKNKQAYRQSLLDQKASENRQAETLASQGLSSGALLVKADAEAKAIQTIAEAQAKTVAETSTSDNTRKNIIIGVVVVVLVVVAIVVIKKFKKK